MKYPYCLPIIKTTKQDIWDVIRAGKDNYAYFEVWLDYVDQIDQAFVEELARELSERLVVVFRRQELKPIHMPLEQRFLLIDSLKDTNVLVDLDVFSQQREIDHVRSMDSGPRLIVSYHNYTETASREQLTDILQQIRKYNPWIIKIATKCQNEKDSLRLLQLQLDLKKDGQKCIILGMGQHGVLTRIFGTLWGNELVFVPENGSERSAPGQLTRKQLDNILQTIGE